MRRDAKMWRGGARATREREVRQSAAREVAAATRDEVALSMEYRAVCGFAERNERGGTHASPPVRPQFDGIHIGLQVSLPPRKLRGAEEVASQQLTFHHISP